MIVYENVMERLADAGWTSYRLIKEHQLGNGSLVRLRRGETVSTSTIDTICRLCGCQPGDILRWEPDQEQEQAE